jgi:hypothetical protein
LIVQKNAWTEPSWHRLGDTCVGLDSPEQACATPVQDYFPEDRDYITNQFFPKALREGCVEVEIRFWHFKTGAALWSDAEIIGRSHCEIFLDIPPRWRQVHARVLAGQELSHEEDPFPRQDGHIDRVQWSMKPWRAADGRLGGAMLSSQFMTRALAERGVEDISTRRHAVEQIHFLMREFNRRTKNMLGLVARSQQSGSAGAKPVAWNRR